MRARVGVVELAESSCLDTESGRDSFVRPRSGSMAFRFGQLAIALLDTLQDLAQKFFFLS